MRNWTLRQQLVEPAVSPFQRKTGRWVFLPRLLQGALAGRAMVRAGALVKNCSFVSCSPLGLLDTNLIAFLTRCLGVFSLYMGSLKVEVLKVQVKLSAPQGKAEYWESFLTVWHCGRAGFILRVCLNLSHLLQCGYFLILPMWTITQLVSGFLTEGTDPGVSMAGRKFRELLCHHHGLEPNVY